MNEMQQHPVVCGTDFSEASIQAANVAAAMAVRLNVPLILAHGVDERGEIPSAYWPPLKESLQPQLRAEAARLRALGASAEACMTDGVPDEGVARCAERSDARLIVLASSGHGSFARWMLGSVSERIAETAWAPTLVLREAARFEDWARGGKPLRVFVGADFSADSDAAMRWASELQEIGPCEFTVGYVDRLADERAEQVMHAPPDTPRVPEMHEMLRHDLCERAAVYFTKQTVHIRVLPAAGHVDAHLLELAGEAQADLIVVGTHQWHGLSRLRHSSVSRRLLHAARISVACVPGHRVVSANSPCGSNARRVLVATDLSTHGSRAIPQAFSMLQLGGAAWLLHVAKPGQALEPLRTRLQELIPTEALAQGFQVKTEVIAGDDIAATICDVAQRFDADLICIGSHGPVKRPAAALGSVAHAVIARSTRPVLIVPQSTS
jgi:nucleotide-binding universal stress UspA family protein